MTTESDNSDMTVLIVDDEEAIIDMTSRMLTRVGFQVHTAATGEAAIESMKQHHPHVVLTDKNLPGMTGLEVISLGKQIVPQSQFIVMTGYASLNSSLDAMKLGVFGYITKPFQRGEVTAQVTAATQLVKKNCEMQAVLDSARESARPSPVQAAARQARAELDEVLDQFEGLVASLASVLSDAPDALRERGTTHLGELVDLIARLSAVKDKLPD